MIKRLQEKEIPELVELGKYVHDNGVFKKCQWSDEALTTFLKECVSLPNVAPMVIKEDGRIVAYMIACATQAFFGTETIIINLAWYVAPDARTKGLGKQLIDFLKYWAAQNQIHEIRMEGTVDMVEYMEKQGFKQTGCTFMLRDE